MFLNCMEWERKVKHFLIHAKSISNKESYYIIWLLMWLLILFVACGFKNIYDVVFAWN